jgi:hypothetical protein
MSDNWRLLVLNKRKIANALIEFKLLTESRQVSRNLSDAQGWTKLLSPFAIQRAIQVIGN